MARLCAALMITLLAIGAAWAEVVIETRLSRLTLNEDATVESLVEKTSGRECVAQPVKLPLAIVRSGGKSFNAHTVETEPGGLRLTFANTDTVLHYAVEAADEWIVFRLVSVEGTRPESLVLVQAPIGITENIGPRLNAAWDDQSTVCLMAITRHTDTRATGGHFATLQALTQDAPGPRIEGAAAALIACPTADFKPIARRVCHAFGLLANEDRDGTPVKDTDLARGSYWFLNFGEAEVDKVIEYCERAGFRQVMMGFGSWCISAGHYLFNPVTYPNGLEGLKGVVDRLHEHGILVGMHTFVSKVSKTDPYVTPIPDTRFWKDMETTLAEDITVDQTQIRAATDLSQWPGSPVCKQKVWEGGVVKHQEVIIGQEIIQYEAIGPEGEWNTFLGCRRGAWGTRPAAHAAGEPAYHYAVDGCINGYIIDQETSLMDEVAERIAGIFNYCGFDMVYFDGGEDVDRRRFNYYVSNFQEQAMRRFTRRPIIHMGTIMTHWLWHSFCRSATVDTYLNTLYGAIEAGAPPERWPTVKDHIDRSVAYMLSVRQDQVPGELGWFGIWPRGPNTDGLQLDEIEYLMCKSLAYDAPISLQTGFSQMEAHPLTPQILDIVREYETLRMSRAVPAEVRERLKAPQQDFALIRQGPSVHFIPVYPVSPVAGTLDVRALVGEHEGRAVATLWHAWRDGTLLLPLAPETLQVTDFSGAPVHLPPAEGGQAVLPVGPTRLTLICPGLSTQALREALVAGSFRLRPMTHIFVRASDARRLAGAMALGSQVGVQEPQAFGDVLVCTDRPQLGQVNDWYAEYTVDIPREGRWAVWARVRYPSGADDSFGIVLPGEPVTLQGSQVLGNCGVNGQEWHWTGQGHGVTSVPPGQPVVFSLKPGPFTFRIYAREGPGTAERNPRLDLLCISEDTSEPPTDEQAGQWIRAREGVN